MTNILFVIPSLDYGGAARQLSLLAAALPSERFQVRVCVLGGPAPWVETLRQAGIVVDLLGWELPFDAAPLLALRKLSRSFQPAVLHAWGKAALAAVLLSGARGASRLVVSHVLEARGGQDWLSYWLLRRTDRVVAFGITDAERYRKLGLAADRVVVVAPATEQISEGTSPACQVLCIGPIEPHKGFRDAVWAFDILRYLHADLRLVVVGDGSDRPRVESFARAVEAWQSTQFLGHCPDLTPHLQRAAVLWAPGRRGGVGAVLAAMAAGRPVVAAQTPELAEIVVEGSTGYLVPPGDKASLARQTRLLLDDPALAQQLGEAGRRRATAVFSVVRLVEQCGRLYE